MDDHLSEDIDIDGVGTFHRYAYMPLQVDGRDSRFYAGFTGEIDSDEDNLYDTDEEEGTLRDEHATIDLSLDDDELEELGDELEELGQRAEESRKALYAAAKRHHQRGSFKAQPKRKRARASPAVVVIDDGTSSDDDYDMRVEIRQPCAA